MRWTATQVSRLSRRLHTAVSRALRHRLVELVDALQLGALSRQTKVMSRFKRAERNAVSEDPVADKD